MLFRLDFQSAVPIYRQIRDQVVLAVAKGELAPGERLPTTRALAEDAGVNVMTVSKAYQLLKAEGYLITDRRAGAVVCARPGKAVLYTMHAEAGETLGLAAARFAASVRGSIRTESNIRGSAAYRNHLAGVLVKRAVQKLG